MDIKLSDDFISYIQTISPMNQIITIKLSTFSKEKFSGIFEKYFYQEEEISISRNQIFEEFEKNTKDGILKAFMWGFPSGGRGNLSTRLVENIDFFVETLDLIKKIGITEFLFEKINSISSVNFATTTKFMYFSNSKFINIRSLIFDQRVKLFIEHYKPINFEKTLRNLQDSSGYNLPHKAYISYISECWELADSLNVSPDVVEMYLFEKAPMKRRPRHSIISSEMAS